MIWLVEALLAGILALANVAHSHSIVIPGLVAEGPAPTLAPTPTPKPLTIPELICSYDWPCQEALTVAECESTFRPGAYNGIDHYGLFQISLYFHGHRLRPGESLYDPVVNVRIAYEIWSESGWQPWECRPY